MSLNFNYELKESEDENGSVVTQHVYRFPVLVKYDLTTNQKTKLLITAGLAEEIVELPIEFYAVFEEFLSFDEVVEKFEEINTQVSGLEVQDVPAELADQILNMFVDN